MAFSKATIKKFAQLSRIAVSDDELEQMNIGGIIDWIEKLQKIDASGAEPMLSPAEHALRFREDKATDGNIADAVLANSPDASGKARGYFAVPKMMEGE
ncbi:MAG: Asp-tRNA(Asn)/Glu-tRNA(Gln) amidotransferase subunit GatC [Rickettsiales bacterium]|jgi:aspartyl-tRNA(Asn)/glutamyl-tRNA(Gln) amidotransferase subunit C|nr:Asp-tRNA(Asn)/Glu-tRNA(Gln) amidotransferase subunit GatC [Rickettsiales bacterium]